MSNCPDMGVDFENGWTMTGICDKNDVDRPSQNNAHYREIIDHFESNLLHNAEKCHAFLNSALLIILKYFEDGIPEVNGIYHLHPFCAIKFLQTVYTNYLS